MSNVTILSDDQLRRERAELVKSSGLTERELRERAERYEVTAEQADTLQRIDEVAYLLDE